jgi:hypothetical protein
MSKTRMALTVAGLACALAVPASASAATPDVKKHIKKADAALAKAEGLVDHTEDATAALQMARANVQTQLADEDARKPREEQKVAFQYDQNAQTFVDLLGEVGGPFQDEVADEITQAVNGRDHAVETLTDLLDEVPEAAGAGITKAIVAIQTRVPQDLESLTGTLASGVVDEAAMEAVLRAVDTVRQSVESAVAQLESLLPSLPPEAQVAVQQAIDTINAQIQQVTQQLEHLFADLPIPSGIPVPSGLPIPPGTPGPFSN